MISQNRLVVLMYHGFLQQPLPVMDPCFAHIDSFREQMIFLKENLQLLPLSAAIERLRSPDSSDPMVSITFDDGFQNNYDLAVPILDELKIPVTIFPATCFLNTEETLWYCRLNHAITRTDHGCLKWQGQDFDLLDNYSKSKSSCSIQESLKQFPQPVLLEHLKTIIEKLGEDPQARFGQDSPFRMLDHRSIGRMAQSGLVEFGAHTHSHAILSRLSPNEICTEIEKSVSELEALTGRTPQLFAYPNGLAHDYNISVIEILKSMKFKGAVTTVTGVNNETTSHFELWRYGISRLNFENFKEMMFGFFDLHRREPQCQN